MHVLLLVTVSATHLIDCVHSNVIQIFRYYNVILVETLHPKKKSFSVSTPGTAPSRLLCAVGSVEWAIIRKREHVQPSINISSTKIIIELEIQFRVQDLQDSSITYYDYYAFDKQFFPLLLDVNVLCIVFGTDRFLLGVSKHPSKSKIVFARIISKLISFKKYIQTENFSFRSDESVEMRENVLLLFIPNEWLIRNKADQLFP